MVPAKVPPAGMNYATVEKRREKGRVVAIVTRVVFGTLAAVQGALAKSKASRKVNTSFLERQNATDRHHNARKANPEISPSVGMQPPRGFPRSQGWPLSPSPFHLTIVIARASRQG
jgi:hypothetical protein